MIGLPPFRATLGPPLVGSTLGLPLRVLPLVGLTLLGLPLLGLSWDRPARDDRLLRGRGDRQQQKHRKQR